MAAYELAKDRFAQQGLDTEAILEALDAIPISIQCWQGDDVLGFENPTGGLTGGIQTSGNYPGRARNAGELRADLEQALALIPGKKRLNLHAIYLDADTAVERDAIAPAHFARWVRWARENDLGLDFNPTCFSHPQSAQNLTLSHPDEAIRKFWIDHCIASRKISEYFGRELTPAVMNIWIPDGIKDQPVDRLAPRQRLIASLDEIMGAIGAYHKVAVEGKLFGIGAESYTAGSNEFYMAYAATRKTLLCLDAGHFHPTENVADKISTALCYLDEILLHVSRPVRWDSDHVVLLDDPTIAIAQEIVRCNAISRVHMAGLLRRQHQPRGGLGGGRAQYAQGPAAGAFGAEGEDDEGGSGFRLHRPACFDRRAEVDALGRGVGILLRQQGNPAGKRSMAGACSRL